MITIWYVLQCPNGQEERLIHTCGRYFPDKEVKDVFRFTYVRMRRYEGEWHKEIMPMFPGYIFLEIKEGNISFRQSRYVQESVALQRNQMIGYPVSPKEEEMLQTLCGQDHHMDMSLGVIQNGITCVTEGPLKGKEAWIRKIDRHKRLAMLDVTCLSSPAAVWTGLEIIAKS